MHRGRVPGGFATELHAGRVNPRVGSGRVEPGQKIYKYEWVGSSSMNDKNLL